MTPDKQLRALVISALWPEPASSGAGLRMAELTALFMQHGWQVTYAATAAAMEHSLDLAQLGIEVAEIRVNDSGFDSFVAALQPDLVLFDRFTLEEQFGWRVEKACPGSMRVVETVDLHLLRDARQRQCKKSGLVAKAVSREELYSETAVREIASLLRSDLAILVSDYEMKLLEEQFAIDGAMLHCCPFMFDDAVMQAPRPGFDERRHFMTVGNFRHPPNWDAVLWLQQEIWPRIRAELPDAELHIYGAYAPAKAMALDSPKSGFRVLGRAENLETVMQASRLCLAPLRFGAGIKTKLADAMLNGTPSVTTSVGAEGMHGALPWCGAIADGADDFADAAVKLYRDRALWQQAAGHGVEILRHLFSATSNGPSLMSRIEAIRGELRQHRLNNFTGAMLRHHHQRSTEYMSRWIEAKSR